MSYFINALETSNNVQMIIFEAITVYQYYNTINNVHKGGSGKAA